MSASGRVARGLALISALVMVVPSAAATGNHDPILRTRAGLVRGTRDHDLDIFRGVRFAQPPTGALRWRAPEPLKRWPGIVSAASFGPPCMQSAPTQGSTDGAMSRPSENCLTLNVWRPRNARRLPIMVWIHGGAFVEGAGSEPQYDGAKLARRGVILVSINYRLGLFGFFAHAALTSEAGPNAPLANYGIMDQVAALRWVKANARAIGGDPDNVTVFGQSAGAVSVLTLMTLTNERLFDKAIHQSGSPWAKTIDLRQASIIGEDAARELGLSTASTADQLRSIPASALLRVSDAFFAQGKLGGFHDGRLTTQPIIDGRLIKENPGQAIAEGHFRHVPVLIGMVNGEDSLIPTNGAADAFFADIPLLRLPEAAMAYQKISATDVYGVVNGRKAAIARSAFQDTVFAAPARWLAHAVAASAPSYLYIYDRRSATSELSTGVGHGGELPDLFGATATAPREFGETLRSCWVSFAKSGRPNCGTLRLWLPVGRAGNGFVRLASDATLLNNFRGQRLDIADRLNPYLSIQDHK